METSEKDLWLAQRRRCITGTDISAIVGVNKWSSPMAVFMDKIGLIEPPIENEPMKWGKALEPVIASRYAYDNQVEIIPGQFIIKNEIFGGTPDYLAPDRLLEIKTAGIWSAKEWGEPGTDEIPSQYLCQVQWYLNLVDIDMASIPVLIGGQDYRIYHVTRNQNLIDILCDAARDFWEKHVVKQEPPQVDESDASKRFLQEFFPKSRGNMIPASDELTHVVRQLVSVKQKISALEESKAALENQIKYAIGDNDGVKSSLWQATWKSTAEMVKIDYEKLLKQLNISPELVQEFTNKKPGIRRFVLTYDKNFGGMLNE